MRVTTLQVLTGAGVDSDDGDCAEAMISAVLAHHRHAVGHARLRLTGCGHSGPGVAQVNLLVHGAPARVQVAGPTMVATIAAAAARLNRQIRRLTTAWEPWPWPDPERVLLGLPGHASIKRRKTYRLLVGLPCQAAARMSAMDYDAYLYIDAGTGEEAIVYRSGPAGLALARRRSMHPPSSPAPLPMTVNPRKTPVLTPVQAAAHLAEGWLPHLFFTNADTGRGNLLYRRYDGQLGLITPGLR